MLGGAAAGTAVEVDYAAADAGEFLVRVGGEEQTSVVMHGHTAGSVDLEFVSDRTRAVFYVSGRPATDSGPGELSGHWCGPHVAVRREASVPRRGDRTSVGASTARVPGTVRAVLVQEGQRVEEGDTLVLLEAMKMEHRIVASVAGAVTKVLVAAGDSVDALQESSSSSRQRRRSHDRRRPHRQLLRLLRRPAPAAREMVEGGPIDVLTGDWLAELTMLILPSSG